MVKGILRTFRVNRVFHTDDSYLGIGSSLIQPHDVVCALKGCDFPVILRREASGFIFICTSLVQGFVDEGVLKDLIDRHGSLEEFEIH